MSWAPTDEEALEQARKWKGAQPQDHYTADWHRPKDMYEHGEQEMSDEEFAQNIVAASDPAEIAERLRELERLGATVLTLQNSRGERRPGARGARKRRAPGSEAGPRVRIRRSQ